VVALKVVLLAVADRGGLDGGRWLWKPFLLSAVFSSALFSPVSFVPSVSLVLPSLQRLRGGVVGGGEEAGDGSCFLFPSAEALLLLLVSFVPSVNAVLPSLQQLHGGAGGREWLG
jgi:hypothetical protein